MKTIKNQIFDIERALYGQNNIAVSNCVFDGPLDGESAFKECKDITVDNCDFHLRYPFWHNDRLKILNSKMHTGCRAPLWYCNDVSIKCCELFGTKALRECSNISIENCENDSDEFGWFCENVKAKNVSAKGEYIMLRSSKLDFYNFTLKGKYSFQYIKDAVFENCTFDTKDAFWHAKNVYVKNCTINGEYLGWYSQNVTFENCTISGTQPLCYCKSLKLINCKLDHADLAFEKSEVDAEIISPIVSIKNPLSGTITVPSVDEVIFDEDWAKGEVITKE